MAETKKIHDAIIFAAKAHEGQRRKGTDIPYITHPFEVAQILMEAGCDEVSDIDDLINLTFNLDCYDIMPGINDEYDLGYYYARD